MFSSEQLLRFDSIVCAVVGCGAYFLPEYSLRLFLTESTDGVHWHMCRVLGGILLGQAYQTWVFARSPFKNVHMCCFMMRIIESTLVIIASYHALAFYGKLFQSKAFLLIFGFNAIVIATNVYRLFSSGLTLASVLTHEKEKALNTLAQIDVFLSLIIGITWFAFPDLILRRQAKFALRDSHLFVSRCFGAAMISTHIQPLYATYFQTHEDRKRSSIGRILMNCAILSAQVYSQFAYHDWWTSKHWIGASLFSIWTAAALGVGYGVQKGYLH